MLGAYGGREQKKESKFFPGVLETQDFTWETRSEWRGDERLRSHQPSGDQRMILWRKRSGDSSTREGSRRGDLTVGLKSVH